MAEDDYIKVPRSEYVALVEAVDKLREEAEGLAAADISLRRRIPLLTGALRRIVAALYLIFGCLVVFGDAVGLLDPPWWLGLIATAILLTSGTVFAVAFVRAAVRVAFREEAPRP